MPGTNPIPIEFTASATNKLVCGLGAVDVSTGQTLAAVIKPKASAAYRNVMSIADSGGTDLCSIEINTSDTPVLVINNAEVVTVVNPLVDNEWYLIVITKPSGSSVPRGHVYRFSTATWVERANGSANADPTGTEHHIDLGEWQDTDPSNFYGAVWAVWNTNLSDGQIDTLVTDLDAWQALSPDWWAIANGTTPLIDETGGTGDESSREASVASAPTQVSPLRWLGDYDSLLFDGVDDTIALSPGGFAGTVDTTYAVAVKLAADAAAYDGFIGYNAIDGIFVLDNLSPHHMVYFPGGGAFPTSVFTTPAADGWCIYAVTVVDAGGVVRFHKYVYATDTWTHSDGDDTASIAPAACTSLHIARNVAGATFLNANFLIAGVWDSALNDAAIEALEGLTPQAWIDAAPDELWRFDTLSAITPLVGTSTETARTGTTLDVGDAPAGWTDGAVSVPGNYYQRIYGPGQLAATATTLYTAPDGARTEIRSLDLNNPSGSLRKVTLSIGSDAAGTRVEELVDVPAGDSLNKRRGFNHTLEAGEILQGYADSAGVVVATVDAWVEQN